LSGWNLTLSLFPLSAMDDDVFWATSHPLMKMVFKLNIARAGEACDAMEPLSGGFVASS